jgi:hypothetical protein
MNPRRPKFDWIKKVLADPVADLDERASETPLKLSVDLESGQLMINLDSRKMAFSLFVSHGS